MNDKDMHARRKVKQIGSFKSLNDLLESSTLSELDKQIVILHYVKEKNFAYIGDELGYSESGIKKRHKKILTKLGQLL